MNPMMLKTGALYQERLLAIVQSESDVNAYMIPTVKIM